MSCFIYYLQNSNSKRVSEHFDVALKIIGNELSGFSVIVFVVGFALFGLAFAGQFRRLNVNAPADRTKIFLQTFISPDIVNDNIAFQVCDVFRLQFDRSIKMVLVGAESVTKNRGSLSFWTTTSKTP